ncbi:MAG: hypothetical protein QW206_02965 [Acidilobaceae archaeon]
MRHESTLSVVLLIALTLAQLLPVAALAQSLPPELNLAIEEISKRSVRIGLFIENYRVGTISVVFSRDMKLCYQISVEYEFSKSALSKALGFEVEEVFVRAKWSVAPVKPYPTWYYDVEMSREASGYTGSILLALDVLNPNLDLRIETLKLMIVVSDGYRGVVWTLDLKEALRKIGVELVYTRGLAQAAVRLDTERTGHNWIRYELTDGSGSRVMIDVVAYPSFSEASVLRIFFSDNPITRGINPRVLLVEISGKIRGSPFSTELVLKSGEQVFLPHDLPQTLVAEEVLIENLVLKLKWNSVFKEFELISFNVTKRIGLVRISPKVLDKVVELPSKVLKIEDLGRGWLAVYIGTNDTVNGASTRVKFEADPGSVQPVFIRAVAIRNFMNHTIVFKVLMFFEARGRALGTLVLERPHVERPTVRLETRLDFEVTERGAFEKMEQGVRFFALPLAEYLKTEIAWLEKKMARGQGRLEDLAKLSELRRALESAPQDTWVLVTDLNTRLSWNKWLETSLLLEIKPSDFSKPVELRLEVVTVKRGSALNGVLFNYLAGGSWGGKLELAPTVERLRVPLEFSIGYTVEELVNGAIAWDNEIRQVVIYVNNAEEVKVLSQEIKLVSAARPRSDPRISIADLGFREALLEPYIEARRMLLTVVLAVVAVALFTVGLSKARRLVLRPLSLTGWGFMNLKVFYIFQERILRIKK